MKVSANCFKIFLREEGDQRTTPVKYCVVMTTFINDDEKILVVAARNIEHKKRQFASNQTECASKSFRLRIEPQKRVFVVLRRATRRWKRLGSFSRLINTISICTHQAHYRHTHYRTDFKQNFRKFRESSFFACAICVQAMCLMCAHTYGVYKSKQRTQAVRTLCRTSQYDKNSLLWLNLKYKTF